MRSPNGGNGDSAASGSYVEGCRGKKHGLLRGGVESNRRDAYLRVLNVAY